MKKSNVTFIAALLIAIHALIFIVVIGNRKGQPKPTPAPVPEKRAESRLPDPRPSPPVELPAPEPVKPAVVAAEVIPVDVVDMPPAAPRESIASTSNIKGYLSANRPNRRTSKIYSSLTGNPYQSAIVIDARTGKILYENRAAAYAYPASVTKLMTLLIVLEQVKAGLTSLDDRVKITKEVAEVGGSECYLDVRESGAFTVNDMLNALLIHSANDAARALALHVAGTRKAFVDMMNQKARELGMNSTVYHSEHGLPPSDGTQPDISTAYDIAILSLAVLRHPETLNYTSTKLAWLPTNNQRKERFMLANRNALVGKEPYPGCDGLKTGYHKRGGFSLTATAKQGNNRVIAVVLGSPDKTTRNNTVRKLLDKGFQTLEK